MARFPSGRGWGWCLRDPGSLRSTKPERGCTTEGRGSIDQGRKSTPLILEIQGIPQKSTRFPHHCTLLDCFSHLHLHLCPLGGGARGQGWWLLRCLESHQFLPDSLLWCGLSLWPDTGPQTSPHCQEVVGVGPEGQCQCGLVLRSG